MWTAVKVYFRKRCENADVRCQRQSLLSSAFPRWPAYTRVLSCVMLALISSIIASIQLNHAIIDIHENYKRRRLNLSRLLSKTTSTFTRVKRLRCRRESKERGFWTRPGRTSFITFFFRFLASRLRHFMRLRAFSCGRVKTLRKRWSFSCGRR